MIQLAFKLAQFQCGNTESIIWYFIWLELFRMHCHMNSSFNHIFLSFCTESKTKRNKMNEFPTQWTLYNYQQTFTKFNFVFIIGNYGIFFYNLTTTMAKLVIIIWFLDEFNNSKTRDSICDDGFFSGKKIQLEM